MDEIVSFGEWVQARRNQLRLSRTALARQVGCSSVTIKKIERDERRPSSQIAELLATHLKIPETEQDDFIRRARGEYVARFGSLAEMSLAEAQAPVAEEDAPKHNLPAQTTSFIGRKAELRKIGDQLARPACRLLTILGAGGMGKTRLSLAVATAQLENFTDGITYVELAPVAKTTAINPLVGTLADALKISVHGGATPEQQLFDYLRRKEMLIVFDNFEHLVETAVFLSDLLAHAPDIKIMTTSRERLNLQEEWLFALQGLSYSEEEMGAMQLFTQRAQQVKSDFDLEKEKTAVLRICQLVEGMPLGLELAAAWVLHLSCQEIAEEIETELDFLSSELRNVPERQSSIRAIFSYSWQRLTQKEQAAMQELSVFRGGFERKAARAVAGASLQLLSSLVGKSLLSVQDNVVLGVPSTPRYQIHELLRQFAAEKLAQTAAGAEDTRNRHSQHYLAFVADQEPLIQGAEGIAAVRAIEQEIDNIRTAVRWSISRQPHLFTKSLGIVLMQFHDVKGWFLEGIELFERIATRLRTNCQSSDVAEELVSSDCLLWAQYNNYLSAMQWRSGQNWVAEATVRQSLQIMPAVDRNSSWVRSWSLMILGLVFSDTEPSITHLEEARELAQASGDSRLYGMISNGLSQLFQASGDFDQAQQMAEAALDSLTALGEQFYSSYALNNLGRVATIRGDFVVAEAYQQACLVKREEIGMRSGTFATLLDLGNLARLQGGFQQAKTYFQQSIEKARELNIPTGFVLWSMGELAVAEGDFLGAKRLFRESGPINWRGSSYIGGPSWAALGLGEFEEAKGIFRAEIQTMLDTHDLPFGLDALVGLGHIEAHNGRFARALEILTLVQHHTASSWEIREKAGKLWEELTAELPPELVAEAETRGRGMDLEETAVSLLQESN